MARMKAPPVGSELSEQKRLCMTLNASEVCYIHVPNGGNRARRVGGGKGMGKHEGVKAGFPDLAFFDLPRMEIARRSFPKKLIDLRLPVDGVEVAGIAGWRGTLIELKCRGLTYAAVTHPQREWLSSMMERGWVAVVAYGHADAIGKLLKLGYRLTLRDPVTWEAALDLEARVSGARDCPFCYSAKNVVEYLDNAHPGLFGCLGCARSWGTK